MAKQAYYFSHDSNAKDDPKIIKLRIKHGWKGYGIFWAIIELLRDQDSFTMLADYESIAFALREDSETIKSIITDFDLFVIQNDFFHSGSLLNRMKLKEEQSEKAREAANKRWNKKSNADAMPTHSERNANPMQLKESKVKEIKVNESIISIDSVRESFSKQSINSLPHFHSLSKAFKLSLLRIEEHFEKWALASIDSMKDLSHCKRSFNLYLENIKRDELDDPNLPSNKYPKSTIKDNWF
jgi:hypothetical protein